eukprot:785428-Pelagomonas_calceolata.AAC.1
MANNKKKLWLTRRFCGTRPEVQTSTHGPGMDTGQCKVVDTVENTWSMAAPGMAAALKRGPSFHLSTRPNKLCCTFGWNMLHSYAVPPEI